MGNRPTPLAPETPEAFGLLAPYYDRMMAYIDYDRWATITALIAELLPADFVHLDAACGTGTLLRKMAREGWNCCGMDRSLAMLRAGRNYPRAPRLIAADLRALPLKACVQCITCLFDSLNFLVDIGDMRRAICEMSDALSRNGLVYLDAITDSMVTKHFAGQKWTEHHGPFATTWETAYCRRTGIADTRISIDDGPSALVRERVYTRRELETAFQDAGLVILGVFDASTWEEPNRTTARMDIVAAQEDSPDLRAAFHAVRARVQRLFR